MIHLTQATFITYGGEKITKEFSTFFREPLWKVKEILLDIFCKADSSDQIIKVINIKYTEYGKED